MSAPPTWPTMAQKQVVWDALGIRLYPQQLAASAAITGLRKLPLTVQVLGGERAGKSAFCGHEAAALAPFCDLIWVVGANYENAEPEFQYLIDDMLKIGMATRDMISKPKEGQWTAKTHLGCTVETISLNRLGADALTATGKAPDLIIMSEAGMIEEAHFAAAYKRIAERRGAVLLAGTLKRSRPWYVALYRSLQVAGNKWHGKSFSFPTWENLALYPGGRDDPTILAMETALGDVVFREQFGAEPVPSPLLVFGREWDYTKHVMSIEYDDRLPIWLACDPGYAGAYALLVVQAASASDVRVLDEFYQQYATWDQAVAWLRSRPYVKSLPDGRIDGIGRAVMDIAGEQHHADRSQVEQWAGATGIRFKSEPVGIDLGISRLRDFLRSPFAWDVSRLRIHPRCEGLIAEIGEREQYPRDQEGQPIRDRPLDRDNHSRKALSYLLVNAFGRGEHDIRPANQPGTGDPFAPLHPEARPKVDLLPSSTPGQLRFASRRRNTGRHPLNFHR